MSTTSLPCPPLARRALRRLGAGTLVAGALAAAAAPAAAQRHNTVVASTGDASAAGMPAAVERTAARQIRFEAVTSAPDTLTLAQLARGVPLALQVVEADGRPIATPVAWRIVRGDVGFRTADARTAGDGTATATLGRTWWARARPGDVVVEARTRVDGMARDSVITMQFALVRR